MTVWNKTVDINRPLKDNIFSYSFHGDQPMKLKTFAGKITGTVRFLTVEQWQEIDREYRTGEAFDLRALAVFIVMAAVLIMGKYVVKTNFIKSFPYMRDLFRTMTYPGLWPELYWSLGSALNYFIFPALIIKFVFRENIRDYGFKWKKSKEVIYLYIAMFVIIMVLAFIMSHTAAFQRKYPFYKEAANSWIEFFSWELSYGSQFFMLEFSFRGFVLFTLARYIGSFAVFTMTLPYVMIHFTKPLPETCGAFIAGVALGTLALRTRSIFGGVILHVSVAWGMDMFTLFHGGRLQKLIQ